MTASTCCSRPTCGPGRSIVLPRSTSSRTSNCAARFSPSTRTDRWGFLVNSLKSQGYKPEISRPSCPPPGAPGGRHTRPARQGTGRGAMDRIGARGGALWPRPHLPGRRCRPRDAADRRFRPQYRRSGRPQSLLEARPGAAGPGGAVAARDLSRRAPAGRPRHHRAEPQQRDFHGPPAGDTQIRQRPARISQRDRPDLRREPTTRTPSSPTARAPPAVADAITQYVPSARPGGRAPHAWLRRAMASASRRSTLSATTSC